MKSFVVVPSSSLSGSAVLPGDKSVSHRAVMVSSISEGKVFVSNFLYSEDCLRTVECMRNLGVVIDEAPGGLNIKGVGLKGLTKPRDILYAGNSGTTIRLLMGILAGQKFSATLTGDDSIKKRPMDRVTKPLTMMGAGIEGREGGKYAPITVHGGKIRAIEYQMPVASAQVKSAILLAGLFADGKTTVIEKVPTRDHTERMLEHFGADIKTDGNRISIMGGSKLQAKTIDVPSDISSAAFVMVAASLIEGSDVVIKNVGVNPGRTGIIDVLHRMGAAIEVFNESIASGEPVADIKVRASRLKGIELSGGIIPRIIDEIPIIALAACLADGETVIRDAEELRVKESDRIANIAKEMGALGAKIKELPDGIIIKGGANLKGSKCESSGDHRIAMMCAVAGLLSSGRTTVEDVECVDTSFPKFAEIMNDLCRKECIRVE